MQHFVRYLIGAALFAACIVKVSSFSLPRPLFLKSFQATSCKAVKKEARGSVRMSAASIPSLDVSRTLAIIERIASAEDKLPNRKELEVMNQKCARGLYMVLACIMG
jgi:hypothetical protein